MGIVLLFLVCSFLGWVLEAVYRRHYYGRFVFKNALRPLPFTPIYGFGALLILALDRYLFVIPWLARGAIYGLLLAGFEVMGGLISERLFGRRMWQYGPKDDRWYGYSDGWHAIIWGLLALMLVYWLHPFLAHLSIKMGIL